MSPNERQLDLNALTTEPGLPALTVGAGTYLCESASVCLAQNGLSIGVLLKVSGIRNTSFALKWPSITQQLLDTYNDLQDATEDGAYGIAILLLRELEGLTVIQRSRKGTGFDYWLGDGTRFGSDPSLVFERLARLEVSGILKGTTADKKARLTQKRKQVQRSAGIPAYIVIVEFNTPSVIVEKSDETTDQ